MVWVDERLHELGAARARQARERRLSLTDCVSFEVMLAEGCREYLGDDEHFKAAGFQAEEWGGEIERLCAEAHGASHLKFGCRQPRRRAVARKHIEDGPKGAASWVRARQSVAQRFAGRCLLRPQRPCPFLFSQRLGGSAGDHSETVARSLRRAVRPRAKGEGMPTRLTLPVAPDSEMIDSTRANENRQACFAEKTLALCFRELVSFAVGKSPALASLGNACFSQAPTWTRRTFFQPRI